MDVFNNNNNGQINEFARYFTAECDGEKIILKRRTEAELTGDAKDLAKDLTGWVRYTAIGLDGKTEIEKTEKITVTLTD